MLVIMVLPRPERACFVCDFSSTANIVSTLNKIEQLVEIPTADGDFPIHHGIFAATSTVDHCSDLVIAPIG
jgi:hypothetical protein